MLREIRLRSALAVVGRMGVLTVGTSLWWIAGLWAQGSFGIDVLRYTETAKTVADASSAPELLRGLGYWYFYGDDKLGAWIEPSVAYTQSPGAIALTYSIPVLGLLARRGRPLALPVLLRLADRASGWCSRSGPTPGTTPPRSARASAPSSSPRPGWPCAACPEPCPCSAWGWPCSPAWP